MFIFVKVDFAPPLWTLATPILRPTHLFSNVYLVWYDYIISSWICLYVFISFPISIYMFLSAFLIVYNHFLLYFLIFYCLIFSVTCKNAFLSIFYLVNFIELKLAFSKDNPVIIGLIFSIFNKVAFLKDNPVIIGIIFPYLI